MLNPVLSRFWTEYTSIFGKVCGRDFAKVPCDTLAARPVREVYPGAQYPLWLEWRRKFIAGSRIVSKQSYTPEPTTYYPFYLFNYYYFYYFTPLGNKAQKRASKVWTLQFFSALIVYPRRRRNRGNMPPKTNQQLLRG